MIDFTREIEFVDGRSAKLIYDKRVSDTGHCFVVLIEGKYVVFVDLSGTSCGCHEPSIRNKPNTIEVWMNIYRNGWTATSHLSKADADKHDMECCCGWVRTARVKVIAREGQFDE